MRHVPSQALRRVLWAAARARFRRGVTLGCVLGALSLPPGCDSCSKEPKVPFKLGDESDSGEPDAGGPAPAEGRSFSPAIDEPLVDDAKLPAQFVRALLLHDLDGDGDRDAIAVIHDAAPRMRMVVSMREGATFLAATDVTGFAAPGDSTCTLNDVRLDALGTDKGVATIKLGCGEPQLTMPASHTVFSLEFPPRVYERFEVVSTREPARFSLSPGGADADGDGHSDVLLEVRETGTSDDTQRLRLAWLDRPSGLSRDLREPEATFAAWSSAAQSQLAKTPELALATAERVIRLERALCREQGAPQLLVSGVPGLVCGNGKASTQALATATIAHARLKQLAEAFASYGLLARRDKLEPKQQERVLSALAGLPKLAGVQLREGPHVEPSSAPRVRLPAARFVDDGTLFLRRPSPALYKIDTSEETSLALATDDLVRDPSGELCVTDIERGLCGLSLRIERAPKSSAPFVGGGKVATPLLEPQPAAPGCSQPKGPLRSDLAGYQVLGWAPQGVVAARGAEVVVVPLTLGGTPASEPFQLSPEAPLPAPLPAGASAPDGSRYLELTPVGVLVRQRGGASPELWRPEGYAAIAASVSEAALSPSGQRVAVVAGGVVYILTRSPSR